MDMEGIGTEEIMACGDATHIAKGMRTKRLRLLPSNCGGGGGFATAMTCSSSSANSADHATADYGSFSSTTTYESSDQEEEDMANCLILLAQGRADSDRHRHQKNKAEDHDHGVTNINKTEKVSNSSRKFAEMATATATKVGFYIYECKTCNRTFPSFQALGGHRASHKKHKITPEEKKPPPSPPQPRVITNHDQFEEAGQPQIKIGPPISLQLGSPQNQRANNKANKVHECSICGSEFTSGQALGGHMRRHRASSTNSTNAQVVGHAVIYGIDQSSCNTTPAAASMTVPEAQPRNNLQLDLNLPAPEDDLRPDSKFQFTETKKSPMVLSAAPALVGCHY